MKARLAFSLALLATFTPELFAASSTWVGATTGTWSATSNWAGGILPGTTTNPSTSTNTDIATFNSGLSGTVIYSGTHLNLGGMVFSGTSLGALSFAASAANTFRMYFTLGGTVFMAPEVMGSVTFARTGFTGSSGTFTFLNNSANSSSTFTFANTLSNNSTGAATLVLAGSNTGSNAINNTISGTSGGGSLSITKDGVGTWILAGANTYNGSTTLNAGILGVGSDTALSTGTVNINGGYLAASGTSRTLSNAIVVGGNFGLGGLGQAITLSGPIDLGGVDRSISASNLATLSGIVSNGGLTLASSGTLILSNASNSYSNGTTLSSGMLVIGGGSGVLGTGTLTVSGGLISASSSTDRAIGNNVVIGGNFGLGGYGTGNLTFGGPVDLGGAVRTLTLNANSHLITGNISNGGLVLESSTNSRKLTLSGSNTYALGTTVNGGTLLVNNPSALGSGSAPVTVNGGVLDLNGNSVTVGNLSGTGGTITTGSTAALTTLTVNSSSAGAFSGSITDTGTGAVALVKGGSGLLTLSGNSYSGGTTLNAGSLGLKSASALGTGLVTINGGAIGSITSTRTITNNLQINADFTAGVNDQSTIINGLVNLGGGVRSITLVNTLTLGGSVSNGGLTIESDSPTRKLTLSGSNNYALGTTVNGGTLVLGNANALGTGALAITNGGSLDLNGYSASLTVLSGTGGITTGSNAATTATLTVNNSAENTYAGAISDNGTGVVALVKNGNGQLTLSGNNYSGGTTLNAGALGIKAASALGTGLVTINGGAIGGVTSNRTLSNNFQINSDFTAGVNDSSLTINGATSLGGGVRSINLVNSLTFGGAISNGGLTISSSTNRNLTLAGNNTYTGATTVNSGNLIVTGSNTATATTVNGGTLRGTGSVGAVVVNSGGLIGAGAAGAIGTFNAGALALNSDAVFELTINTAAGTADLLNVTGDFSLDNANSVVLNLSDIGTSTALAAGTKFTFLTYTGNFLGGYFKDYAANVSVTTGLNQFKVNYTDTYNGANAVSLEVVSMEVVPEPSSGLLLLGGLATLAARRRAKRN